MLSTNDRKVAALLLNEGHLTREQINECVGIKERLEEPRSLASILVARRYVTYDRLKSIMANAIQRVQSREFAVATMTPPAPQPFAAASPPAPVLPSQPQAPADNSPSAYWNMDKELASLLVARHIVTEAQARECLGLLMQVLKTKQTARLTQVILKRRYASRDALRHVLKEYETMKARRKAGSGPQTAPRAASSPPAAPPAPAQFAPPPPPAQPQFAPPPSSNSGSFETPPLRAPSSPSPFASSPGQFNNRSGEISGEITAPAPLPGMNGSASTEDPFASVKPTRQALGGFDSQAPLRFGSGADFAAVGSGSDQDNSRTVNLQVPSQADLQQPPQGLGASVEMGNIVNQFGASNEVPIGLDSADSEVTLGVRPAFQRPNPLNQGSNAMFAAPPPPSQPNPFGQGSGEVAFNNGFSSPSGVAPAPSPFSSNFSGSSPVNPVPSGLNSPPTNGFGGARDTTPNGFKTMDLDDGEVTLSPLGGPAPSPFASGPTPAPAPGAFASGPVPSPFASGPVPMSGPISGPAPAPFASGPTPAPAPGAFASGPVPSPFASGPTPAPAPFASGPTPAPAPGAFASGPVPSPFASGPVPMSGPMSASGPMGSAAAPPPGFRTFDLDSQGSQSGPMASTGARRSTKVEQSAMTSSARKKKKKKKTQSKSRASVDRKSRAEIAAELQGKSFQTFEVLIGIGCILFVLALGYGGYSYIQNKKRETELKDEYNNARNLGNNSAALELVRELLKYQPDDAKLQDEEEELRAKVEAEERRNKSVEYLTKAKNADSAEEAVKLCREAVKNDETFATALVELGRSLYRLAHAQRRKGDMSGFRERLNEANENLREALVHQNDNQVAHFYLSEVIREQAKTIDRSTATDLKGNYTRGVTADKQSFYGMMCDARLRQLRGFRDEALKFVNLAVEKDKTQVIALMTRAEIRMQRREYSKALSDLKRVGELEKDNADALFLEAHVHYKEKNWDKGLKAVEAAMKIDKGSAYGMGLKAYGMWNKDPSRKNEAIRLCEKAVKFDDRHFYPYRVHGEIVLGKEGEEQDLNLASRLFLDAIARAKYFAENYFLYGKTLQFSHDNAGADKNYATCLRYDKKHFRGLVNRGTVLRILKNYDEALDHYNKARKLDRYNAQLIFQCAKVKWEKLSSQSRSNRRSIRWDAPQWEEVLNDLNEAIAQNSKIADMWGRRGYLKQKRIWAKIVASQPEEKRNRAFRKQCAPALNDFDQAIELDRGQSTYWNGVRCLLYVKIGRYRDAIEDGEKFLKDKRRKVLEQNVQRKVDAALKECRRILEKQSGGETPKE